MAFNQVLERHSPAVRKIANKLRELVRKAAPQAEERVHLGWHNVAWYVNGMFCYVQPHREWVNIGWPRGTELDDPDGLLTGSGRGMRHVKVRLGDRLPAVALTRMVKQAYRLHSEQPKVKVRAARR